jgi:hypothetical protein
MPDRTRRLARNRPFYERLSDHAAAKAKIFGWSTFSNQSSRMSVSAAQKERSNYFVREIGGVGSR